VLSDRIMITSAALFPYYVALWNRLRARHGSPPAPPGYGYAEHLYHLAVQGDRPDTVEDQVAWLRAAGFGAAGCFYRYLERAVFGGLKGAEHEAIAEPNPALVARFGSIYGL
jgi:hypothetical protein